MSLSASVHVNIDKHTYLKATNVKMTRPMATTDTDTPTYPTTSNESTTASVRLGGDALSIMAK